MIRNSPPEELESAKTLMDWALGETAAMIYAWKFVVPLVDAPLVKGAVPISRVNTIFRTISGPPLTNRGSLTSGMKSSAERR